MDSLERTKRDLTCVLKYTEELLSFNEKVIFDLAREPYPHFPEHLVAKLEGVDTAVDNETWLSVRRLRETRPPECSPMFQGWVDSGQHPSPDHPPKLIPERLLNLSSEELAEMAKNGMIPDPQDIMQPLDIDEANPKRMDVIFRIARMPEFCQQWQDYLDGPWRRWAEIERPRRRSIDFYNKMYQIYQRMMALGDDTPIELVFGVGITRWHVKDTKLNIPIIEQLVEIEMKEDGTLLVRPRQTAPGLALRPFHVLEIEGSKNVQRDIGHLFERIVEDPDVGFSPFDKSSFERILRLCSARLSGTGIYHPDTLDDPNDRTLPILDEFLRVTDTWVIYVRQRNEDFRKNDIRRLIQNIEKVKDEDQLPAPGVKFVINPSDELTIDPGGILIDLTGNNLTLPESPSGWQSSSRTYAGDNSFNEKQNERKNEAYFFPLPYNDEQKEIILRLEDKKADGVLVQGPPGTGKTHTIANIICHYLATKRRVLVTAKTPEALTALQEKLPEGIRDLAIAVIHNDREGARQLEQAVRLLADEAKAVNPKIIDEQIREKQARIASLRDIIAKVDGQLYALAEHNLARVRYRGEDVLPMALAKMVTDEEGQHEWFKDSITMATKHDPLCSGKDIDEIRRLRLSHAGDLIYDVNTLPDLNSLPPLAKVLAAHRELARIKEIIDRSNTGEIPFMSLDGDEGINKAKQCYEWVKGFAEVIADVQKEIWLFDIYHMLIGLKRIDQTILFTLKDVLEHWIELRGQGNTFLLQAVVLGDPTADPGFDRAIADLASGRRPFGLFSFFKGGLKAKIDAVRIEGRSPVSEEDWATVHNYRKWQHDVLLFVGRWNGVARVIGSQLLPTEWSEAHDELFRLGLIVERLWKIHNEVEHNRRTLQKLFPYGLNIEEAIYHGRFSKAIEALATNLEKTELANAYAIRAQISSLAGDYSLPFHCALREICGHLGQADVPQTAIIEAWQQITAEAMRLSGIAGELALLDNLVAKVASSGAPLWAKKLRSDPPVNDTDVWTPTTWRKSWEWAQAYGYLQSLGDWETTKKLSDTRAKAEAEQKKLFAEIVRLRTFLGLKLSLTDRIESALAKFGAAIARLGKATGKSAGRHRRIIRESAMETVGAVPCWILPEWRVAEQLPPDLATFDLVIIDEASQSDITALPAILRGKKVLIVGDDKQVSPTPIGIEERKIIQLRTTFLTGLPFADQMDPATSIYELGGMVFPGKAIMLQEHFRCVEPIIRFSSRFYPKPLVPLRISRASERLNPPLIDIYVPHGQKNRELNIAEADVICAEIAKLVADPACQRRSIGVISLIGQQQAKLIYQRLVRELGAEIIEKHRIICGSSAAFQGQERDIMFLSMVACPQTAIAQTSRMFEQRFNVAMSRAKDRVILVRSVASSHLRPGDLKLALIEHFRNPMGNGSTIRRGEVLDLCDSEFERDFGSCLLDLGYRINPQIAVGNYRIDFVIEGADDRRLAIELDGDKYHGPDKWAADIRRQKALERLGWVFWRCWGSAWIADRQGCLEDLRMILQHLKIEPLGMTPSNEAYTLHFEVPSPTADTETVKTEATQESAVQELEARDESPNEMFTAPIREEPMLAPIGEVSRESRQGNIVEIGDLVIVHYNESTGPPLRIRLSANESRPQDGIISAESPLGAAILGASVDDEVEVSLKGKLKTAVIEMIEKAS